MSNLPPGCSTYDLPGGSLDDVARDRAAEAYAADVYEEMMACAKGTTNSCPQLVLGNVSIGPRFSLIDDITDRLFDHMGEIIADVLSSGDGDSVSRRLVSTCIKEMATEVAQVLASDNEDFDARR